MIEITRFRLLEGVDEAEFRAADARLQMEFAYQQPGLLRRTTARGADGEWVVVDLWRSPADADACAGRWDDDATVKGWTRLLAGGSLQSERYAELDS